jgi:hypothetical protein
VARPPRFEPGSAELLVIEVVDATGPSVAAIGDAVAADTWFAGVLPRDVGHVSPVGLKWYDLARQDPDVPRSVRHLALVEIAHDLAADVLGDAMAIWRTSLAEAAAGWELSARRFRAISDHVTAPGTPSRAGDGLLVVLNNAADGRLAEYHRWYDAVHIPETFGVLGTTGAQRFEHRDDAGGDPSPQRFLVLYDVPAESIDDAERRRVALVADRQAAAARGSPPQVPVPAAVVGPRYASWFRARQL